MVLLRVLISKDNNFQQDKKLSWNLIYGKEFVHIFTILSVHINKQCILEIFL